MLKEYVPLLFKTLNTSPFSHPDILSFKSPNFFLKGHINPSTWEAERGRKISEFGDSLVYRD